MEVALNHLTGRLNVLPTDLHIFTGQAEVEKQRKMDEESKRKRKCSAKGADGQAAGC